MLGVSNDERLPDRADIELISIDTGPVMEMGPPLRRPRPIPRVLVLVVVFTLGVAVGLVLDRRSMAPALRTPANDTAANPEPGVLTWSNASCSKMSGSRLVIGLQITNYSFTPVTLTGIVVTAPQQRFQVRGTSWTQCTDSVGAPAHMPLHPDVTQWVSVSVDLLASCSALDQIKFTVTYLQDNVREILPAREYQPDAVPECPGR